MWVMITSRQKKESWFYENSKKYAFKKAKMLEIKNNVFPLLIFIKSQFQQSMANLALFLDFFINLFLRYPLYNFLGLLMGQSQGQNRRIQISGVGVCQFAIWLQINAQKISHLVFGSMSTMPISERLFGVYLWP